MLRAVLILIPSILLACSSDKQAPTAPLAGKSNCVLCGILGTEMEQQEDDSSSQTETTPDTTATVQSEDQEEEQITLQSSDGSFDIELIFIGEFNNPSKYSWLNEKRYVKKVASQWEEFFYDMEDYTFPSNTTIRVHNSYSVTIPQGEVIDDIRIYVDFLTPETNNRTEIDGWTGGNITTISGVSGVTKFRADGNVPLIATILINQNAFAQQRDDRGGRWGTAMYGYKWRQTFQHELGHAFGIGPSPAWEAGVEWTDVNTPWFTGANATNSYRTMLTINDNPNDVIGVPLAKIGFSQDTPIHWGGRPSIMTWSFFDVYWLRENELVNLSIATLGAFDDIGWSVKYDKGMVRMPNPEIGLWPCFMTNRGNGSEDFHMCPPEGVSFPAMHN
ncbi:MAG: hypothetical protein OXN90_16730 [Gemmatimonadota bacterium]|nr:hypothetical protein [Gemmatimonadota bacterium]